MGKIEKARKDRVLIRIMKAPIRALCRARDLYISSMNGCAGHLNYGAVGYPLGGAASLPRSFSLQSRRSSCSSEEDLRELVRAASQKAVKSLNRGDNPPTVKRSQSVAISRIDEDKPCEFDPVSAPLFIYPRSRSYQAPARRVAVIG